MIKNNDILVEEFLKLGCSKKEAENLIIETKISSLKNKDLPLVRSRAPRREQWRGVFLL